MGKKVASQHIMQNNDTTRILELSCHELDIHHQPTTQSIPYLIWKHLITLS